VVYNFNVLGQDQQEALEAFHKDIAVKTNDWWETNFSGQATVLINGIETEISGENLSLWTLEDGTVAISGTIDGEFLVNLHVLEVTLS
jgi:hypothetical protein